MSLGTFSHVWHDIRKTSDTLKLNSTLTDLIDGKYIMIKGKRKKMLLEKSD